MMLVLRWGTFAVQLAYHPIGLRRRRRILSPELGTYRRGSVHGVASYYKLHGVVMDHALRDQPALVRRAADGHTDAEAYAGYVVEALRGIGAARHGFTLR